MNQFEWQAACEKGSLFLDRDSECKKYGYTESNIILLIKGI